MSWQTVALDEVAVIQRTGIDPASLDHETPYVGLEHIESGGRLLEVTPVSNGELKSTKFAFGPDHILYGKLRPYLAKIALPQFEGICSTDILPILPTSRIDRSYLCHFLRQPSMVEYAASRAEGANLPRLSPKALAKFEIPLPPLDEQRRIAAILDQADQLRQKRRQAIALLESLTQSIFLEMFGDSVSNPKGLQKEPLGNLIKVSSGNGLTSAQMDTAGIYSVYGGNGINGSHSAYMFEDPQIAIGRVGVYCGAVHVTKPKSWITDNALYISKNLSGLRLRYLAEALRMANLNQYAGRAAQPLISGSRIYPVEILVPSEEMQFTFEKLLLAADANHRQIYKSQEQIDAAFSSLQHRAFSGQL